jgi:glycosyltransferase involved in cell wall biosynthesis
LINHDGPVVLFVGRLVDGKRPQDAIEAIIGLPDELNAKLFVVGDGPLREDLGACDETVEFLGQVPYDEMPTVYRAGDVLHLPSRAEGLPRTVLEAFASGVPVVSSHLEHTASVVQQGGETVQVGDVTGYRAALERVLAERKVLGEQGREAVEEKFQWDETVMETTKRLERLL